MSCLLCTQRPCAAAAGYEVPRNDLPFDVPEEDREKKKNLHELRCSRGVQRSTANTHVTHAHTCISIPYIYLHIFIIV